MLRARVTTSWLIKGLIAAIVTGAAMPLAARDPDQKFPDILAAQVTPRGADIFDFDVTVSSLYDTPRRYADAFRVLSPDGRPLGERVLLHDHANEQPFTRELQGVRVPPGILVVVIQGRDKANGYGGKTLDVALPGR
jgi:hypothetical protein